MGTGPWTLAAALLFLLVAGVSGGGVGLTLVVSMSQVNEPTGTGLAIGASFLVYGVALAIAGIGLLVRRRWAWWLGVASVVLGLLVLVVLVVVYAGSDRVLEGGILLWAAALACLLAPATRRSLRT